MRVVEEVIGHLQRVGDRESGREREDVVLDRRGGRDHLVHRSRLVDGRDREVLVRRLGIVGEMVRVEPGVRRHGEDVAAPRVDHDERSPLGAVPPHRGAQCDLRPVLQLLVDRRHDVGSRLRRRVVVHPLRDEVLIMSVCNVVAVAAESKQKITSFVTMHRQ